MPRFLRGLAGSCSSWAGAGQVISWSLRGQMFLNLRWTLRTQHFLLLKKCISKIRERSLIHTNMPFAMSSATESSVTWRRTRTFSFHRGNHLSPATSTRQNNLRNAGHCIPLVPVSSKWGSSGISLSRSRSSSFQRGLSPPPAGGSARLRPRPRSCAPAPQAHAICVRITQCPSGCTAGSSLEHK